MKETARSLAMLGVGVAGFVALVQLAPGAIGSAEPRWLSLALFVGLLAMVRMLGKFEPPRTRK